ncbi:MAG: prolyl oligopeptidase family serine peptidase [Gemmataceae bacterium]|nr:prolyl oligopeptidase family serine peptidase [Gemmataceae bacterium]
MFRWSLALLVCLIPSQVSSQEPTPGEAMMRKYLDHETKLLEQRALAGAKDRKSWEDQLPRLKREYFDMLGLWPLPPKTDLKAKITRTTEHDGVLIDSLHFQSVPHLYATCNFYRPKSNDPSARKLPTIVYVCGHSNRGRDGNKTAFIDHGMWFAKHGYNCLILDTLQLGEIPGIHHGTYRHDRWFWHSLGYTSAGVECWNGVRALDWLTTRNDVDADKLGVTGISGGGAATLWIAAADERVKVVVPVSGMSDLAFYVPGKGVNGHCDCMFLHNQYSWDLPTIAALVAPRPMLFANSDNDPIFPMDGNRRIMAKLKTAWGFYEKADLVQEYVSPGGHDYRPDLRKAIFAFFEKHLRKADASKVDDAEPVTIKGKDIRVFAADQDFPDDRQNADIDTQFVRKADLKAPPEGKFEEWRKERMAELRQRVFTRFPERIPAAFEETRKEHETLLKTEHDILVVATRRGKINAKAGTILVLGPGESASPPPDWTKPYLDRGPAYLIEPRGCKRYVWPRKSPPNTIERSLALLGTTVDQGRVWDIAAAARWVAEQEKGIAWTVVGRGEGGVLAVYAALFEPLIAGAEMLSPTESHMQGPHFLSVLRVIDVPEAAGMLAPRPLKIVSAAEAFQRTADIYKAAAAESKLVRAK